MTCPGSVASSRPAGNARRPLVLDSEGERALDGLATSDGAAGVPGGRVGPSEGGTP